MAIQAGFAHAGPSNKPLLGVNITYRAVTQDYAVTGEAYKAFRIVDGEHLKTRLNVLEPGSARTLANWDLSTNAF
jgi:hypothetical protein